MMNKANKQAMDRFKYEVANELGVNLKEGYNGDLTARENGSVGGMMVKKMIEKYESELSNK
ncbi:MAG: alpha/beta-type small acid-soluble spore protein [Ruminococcaceae bacterium]|nr:alpha/beta-type small acid-soluble spore protein [Oscillospiraceae bacterium]